MYRQTTGKFPLALTYLSDSSAIFVGSTSTIFSQAYEDFYIARISGVGVPYNPATALATKPAAGKALVQPYPNPCTTTLRFTGLATPAHLQLFSLEGKRQLQTQLQPGAAASTATLPKGLYVWRLTAAGNVWSGRLIKN